MAALFLRLVHGNAANPGTEIPDGESIGARLFVGVMFAWERGEITRAQVISHYSLTVDDETDLDSLKAWYNAATDKEQWLRVFKDRLYLAQNKDQGPDGEFGYAVKNTFINGLTAGHSLNGDF